MIMPVNVYDSTPPSPSAYLAEIEGEAVIIIALNISAALDAIALTGKEGHLVYQKSLPVLYNPKK